MAMTRYPEGIEITEVTGGNTAGLYLGPNDENGTWRIREDSDTMKLERMESGSYSEKLAVDEDGNVSAFGDIEAGGSVAAIESEIYLGDPEADGTWRIRVDGSDLKLERMESGEYVTKQTFAGAGE